MTCLHRHGVLLEPLRLKVQDLRFPVNITTNSCLKCFAKFGRLTTKETVDSQLNSPVKATHSYAKGSNEGLNRHVLTLLASVYLECD